MAQSDGKGAVGREIAGALEAAVAAADAEQLDLMLPGLRERMSSDEKSRVVEAVKRDKAGRPEGSRNLVTRDMLEFVRKVFGDPVERRARWLQHTPESLAIVLGCSKIEAFDRLDRIAADLQRLFYAPKAPVDADGNPAPWLSMTFGSHNAGQPGLPAPGAAPWTYLDVTPKETQQNQALLEPVAARSHGERSHDGEDVNNLSGLAK